MTFSEFINMSGYGHYVWSSFGITLVLLVWQVIQPINELNELKRKISKSNLRNTKRR